MHPRFLYLHGFASGPHSAKAVAFGEHYGRRGVGIDRLDLQVPSFEKLRLSAMIAVVQRAIGSPADRAVVFGSSLGGLTAARVAERDPRITGLVLLAPAFRITERWRKLPDWDDWRRLGWREVHSYATNRPARIEFGFAEDVMAIDVGLPDVRVPTLILHGKRDDVVPIEHSREFADGKPHVRLVELDDGHDLLASLPRMFSEADRFLVPWLGEAGGR
jgi:pimeloyl-ACP methyl ester carboxylesterase